MIQGAASNSCATCEMRNSLLISLVSNTTSSNKAMTYSIAELNTGQLYHTQNRSVPAKKSRVMLRLDVAEPEMARPV